MPDRETGHGPQEVEMRCTCGIKIKDHPESACLDALFCTEVMEWHLDYIGDMWMSNNRKRRMKANFNPSSNIQHAMEGVEYTREHYPVFQFEMFERILREHLRLQWTRFDANVLALYITRALILWAMEKK